MIGWRREQRTAAEGRQCCSERCQQQPARLQRPLAACSGGYTAVAGSRAHLVCVCGAVMGCGCVWLRVGCGIDRRPSTLAAIMCDFEGNRPFGASIGHTISRALRARARSAARVAPSARAGFFSMSAISASDFGRFTPRRCSSKSSMLRMPHTSSASPSS